MVFKKKKYLETLVKSRLNSLETTFTAGEGWSLQTSSCANVAQAGVGRSAHRSGDGQEAVVADKDDVEDGCGAEQIVHDQPEFTQPSAQHPPACQGVGDVDWDAEST